MSLLRNTKTQRNLLPLMTPFLIDLEHCVDRSCTLLNLATNNSSQLTGQTIIQQVIPSVQISNLRSGLPSFRSIKNCSMTLTWGQTVFPFRNDSFYNFAAMVFWIVRRMKLKDPVTLLKLDEVVVKKNLSSCWNRVLPNSPHTSILDLYIILLINNRS